MHLNNWTSLIDLNTWTQISNLYGRRLEPPVKTIDLVNRWMHPSPHFVSRCFAAAVHQQTHQTFTRRLPGAAMAVLGGQISRTRHGAVPLCQRGWRRRLAGFVGFVTRLPLCFAELRKAHEEEEEDESGRQDIHGGWETTWAGKYECVWAVFNILSSSRWILS